MDSRQEFFEKTKGIFLQNFSNPSPSMIFCDAKIFDWAEFFTKRQEHSFKSWPLTVAEVVEGRDQVADRVGPCKHPAGRPPSSVPATAENLSGNLATSYLNWTTDKSM